MRSRPLMTVLLKPGLPRPGELLEVEARLRSSSETPLDRVSFELIGLETVTVQRGRSTGRWSHTHIHLRAEHPSTLLTPGDHTYRARFELPRALPPRYLGRYSKIDYTLEVRADIPWWPDRVGRYDVPLVPLIAEIASVPGVFVTEYGGAKGSELYAELSLAATTVESGGEVVGTVAFSNVAGGGVRGARIALVASERLFAQGTFMTGGSAVGSYEVLRLEYKVGDGVPPEGRSLPFRLAIGPDTVPTFTASISALDWALEVIVDRSWSNRALLRVPIVILPSTGRAERSRPGAAPAVGRERRARSWQEVGERFGLTYEAQHEELRGAAGAVGIRIAVETRADGALATVARLGWPALGMGFRVTPGSWTDRLAPREIDVGFEHFDRRFHVRGRVPEQVRALLDAELCALLMGFAEVLADDDGAELAVGIALVDPNPLTVLLQRTAAVARAFDTAFARVPLPAPLAAHAGPWRDFAARLGGRFESGRGAIHEGAFGLERVDITSEWSESGELLATVVRIPLGVRIDPEAVSTATRALGDSLAEQARARLTIAENSITLRLPRLVTDPAELEPVLEGATRLVHALRGRGAAGPFR